MRIALILLAFASAAHAADFESRYYSSVFSGDLSWVTEVEPQTPSGQDLKARFDDHFLNGTDGPAITEIEDPLVRAIARRFVEYWRQALLAPQDIQSAERRLFGDIAQLVEHAGYSAESDDFDGTLSAILADRGYQYRGGRTRPLLDFMLWSNTRTVEYDVELTDSQQPVVVNFLDDFIVRGWAYFATFGRSGTGGWADPDALYCISAAYDVESEKFKNSYLRHEARHFADYERFPGLESVDLEYRGKLTELAFASNAMRLLHGFEQHSNGATTAPHPLANWRVVNDMIASVPCDEAALSCLESVSNEELQSIARNVLVEHTNKLESEGATR